MVDAMIGALLLLGSAFVFLGSLGICKLPDAYARLHAPTKATTLGLGALLVASAVEASRREPGVSVHELLVVLLLFLTAPISAQLLASAALHLRLGSSVPLPDDSPREPPDDVPPSDEPPRP